MDTSPVVESSKTPPIQALPETAATQNPTSRCRSTQSTLTTDPRTTTRDFAPEATPPRKSSIRLIHPPTTSLQILPAQATVSSCSISAPAQYITPHPPSSAAPPILAQSWSAQPDDTDEITNIPQINSSSTQTPYHTNSVNNPPRRNPLPPRPADFRGGDRCWETLHERTVAVSYSPPAVERDRGCWGWVKEVLGWKGVEAGERRGSGF